MISNPLFTTPKEKISATELFMLKKKVGGLPVVDEQKKKVLVGIITQRDIRLARFAVSLESPHTLVKDLMTPEPYIAKKDDTISQVLSKMFKYNIERLPVINDNNELIGLVLVKSILKKLMEFLK
jgi:IMP dehydrogenase